MVDLVRQVPLALHLPQQGLEALPHLRPQDLAQHLLPLHLVNLLNLQQQFHLLQVLDLVAGIQGMHLLLVQVAQLLLANNMVL